MGMTITEKIIASHAGRETVSPGDFVYANVDIALANDITAPLAIRAFREAGATRVFDRERVVLVPDHFTPNKDIASAEQARILRDFAKEHDLTHYYEVGRMGIEHALLPEQGVVVPGDFVVGADSHTCTYGALGAFSTGMGSTDLAFAFATGKVWIRVPASLRFELTGAPAHWVQGKDLILTIIGRIGVDGALYKAMEFVGDAVAYLSIDDRLTVSNMAIEAGGKNGIWHVDAVTREYEEDRAEREPRVFTSDDDAVYEDTIRIEMDKMEPVVACPHLPSNVHPVRELADTPIDQVVIGSCTNGRLSDLRQAAAVLAGRQVAPNVRCIILPGTQAIYLEALREGLIEQFIDAGAAVSTPTCGPCLGGHMGVLAAGERAVSTTNRNFVGRMGDTSSEVFLASPVVAAASAVAGAITHPEIIAPEARDAVSRQRLVG